jgi:hypothetical protein
MNTRTCEVVPSRRRQAGSPRRWLGRTAFMMLAGSVGVVGLMVTGSDVAGAEVIRNEEGSFTSFPVNRCNGEFIPFTGEGHFLSRLQPDGSFVQQMNGHFTAIGSKGNTYELNWNERFISSSQGGSFASRQQVISKGAEPNFFITFSFSFNPFSFPPPVAVCRG